MFYFLFTFKTKWNFLKKEMRVIQAFVNQILGLLYSILFSCSDFVGYGKSLSNIITKSVTKE